MVCQLLYQVEGDFYLLLFYEHSHQDWSTFIKMAVVIFFFVLTASFSSLFFTVAVICMHLDESTDMRLPIKACHTSAYPH